MRYLWTEDAGAGLHFWKLVNKLFFNGELVVLLDFGKKGYRLIIWPDDLAIPFLF